MILQTFFLEKIEESMREILRLYFSKKINEGEVLAILNKAARYSDTGKIYLFEMLFIEGLKTNKIPRSTFLISQLLINDEARFNIYQDVKTKFPTQLKVLSALKLTKTKKLYEKCLDETQKKSVMYENIYDLLTKELKTEAKTKKNTHSSNTEQKKNHAFQNTFLLEKIEMLMREILQSYFSKKINGNQVLSIIKKAAHNSQYGQIYLFEMLFVEAIKINKIPKSLLLVSQLFTQVITEYHIFPDDASEFQTRLKVLTALELTKTKQLWQEWLNHLDPELNAPGREVTFEMIYDSLAKELKPRKNRGTSTNHNKIST